VPQVGIINPGEFAPANSIEVVIWTAVGGRATLIGPIIGAILVNGGKTIFTGLFPEVWLFALGGLFVAVTLFLPRGVVGTIAHYGTGGRRARQASVAAEKGESDEPIQAAE
jgi:urea transport system permease protein